MSPDPGRHSLLSNVLWSLGVLLFIGTIAGVSWFYLSSNYLSPSNNVEETAGACSRTEEHTAILLSGSFGAGMLEPTAAFLDESGLTSDWGEYTIAEAVIVWDPNSGVQGRVEFWVWVLVVQDEISGVLVEIEIVCFRLEGDEFVPTFGEVELNYVELN